MPEIPAQEPLEHATRLVADTVAELMSFWGFKPSMGRVWAVLYLSRRPLCAAEIARRSGLSAGSVSMTVGDLLQWGVVRRAFVPGERRRVFEAETDIWSMVRRVFRRRELELVRSASSSLAEALRLADELGRGGDPDTMLRSRFLVTRIRRLLDLAGLGERMIERLVRSGSVDLAPLKRWVEALRRRSSA